MRRKSLIGALLLVSIGVILGATVFRTDIAQATGLAQGVTVTNTPAQAVPVREQALDGQNIRVHEEGTANVNVSNSLTVNEAGTPVQAQQTFFFAGDPSEDATYTVPNGKRLRIDLITFHDLNRTAGVRSYVVITRVAGTEVFHYMASSTQAGNGDVVTEPVTIYADPGTTVTFVVHLDSSLGAPGSIILMDGSFSGILTDAA